MPRTARPWFRFYVEAVADRKVRRLKPEHRWLFVACLAAARQSPEAGVLLVAEGSPMDCRDLADFAGMDLRTVRAGMVALAEAGLIVQGSSGDSEGIAYRSPAFLSRQYESDDVTARTRKHRATRANAQEGTSHPGSQERSPSVVPTPQSQRQTHRQTAEHPPVGSPHLAPASPTPDLEEGLDFTHHPKPALEPEQSADLVGNLRQLRSGLHPSPEDAA